jgi:hypothetical protein
MKFIQYLEVFNLFVDGIIGVGPDFLGPDVFQDDFSLFGIIPEVSLLADSFFVFDFYSLAIVVKDTSSRQPRGPSSLSTVQWS